MGERFYAEQRGRRTYDADMVSGHAPHDWGRAFNRLCKAHWR